MLPYSMANHTEECSGDIGTWECKMSYHQILVVGEKALHQPVIRAIGPDGEGVSGMRVEVITNSPSFVLRGNLGVTDRAGYCHFGDFLVAQV